MIIPICLDDLRDKQKGSIFYQIKSYRMKESRHFSLNRCRLDSVYYASNWVNVNAEKLKTARVTETSIDVVFDNYPSGEDIFQMDSMYPSQSQIFHGEFNFTCKGSPKKFFQYLLREYLRREIHRGVRNPSWKLITESVNAYNKKLVLRNED